MSGDKYKLYKEIREDSARRITRDINDKCKKEIYATRDCYDKSLFDYGVKYHGNPTEEISVEIKNNTNFINGYNYAKRKAKADNFRGSE